MGPTDPLKPFQKDRCYVTISFLNVCSKLLQNLEGSQEEYTMSRVPLAVSDGQEKKSPVGFSKIFPSSVLVHHANHEL